MPNFLIKPKANHLADANDLTGAVLALDTPDPGTVGGLPNGVTHVAFELVLSPASSAFTPADIPDQMAPPTLSVAGQTIQVTFVTTTGNNGSPITTYDLRYSTDQANWTDVTDVTSPYTLTLSPQTDYFVQTRATNSVGSGPWSLSASATTGQGVTAPAPFIPGDWSISDAETGATAALSITMMPADGGAAITDIEYRLFGGPWISVGGAATGTYLITDFADGVITDVEIRAVNSVGGGPESDIKTVTTTLALSFVEDTGGEAELVAVGSGDITITNPGFYAGTYTVDMADLAGGPEALVTPAVSASSATPGVGETVSVTPGLWLYESGPLPTLSYQWRRDGAAITGATGSSYTLAVADGDTQLSVTETASQTGTGARSATSAGIAVSAGASDPRSSDAAALYWFAPDSVQRSGSTITNWNDKTANGHNLGQVSSIGLPSYNTGGDFVYFNGSQLIGSSSFAYADSMMAALSAGGTTTLWAVCRPDPTSATNWFTVLREGVGGSAAGNNFCMQLLGINVGNYGYEARNRGTAATFQTTTPFNAAMNNALVLVELTVTQTTSTINVNNGAFTANSSVDASRFSASGDGLSFGAADSGSGSAALGFEGAIYEIYASATTSASLRTDIRNKLLADYGL